MNYIGLRCSETQLCVRDYCRVLSSNKEYLQNHKIMMFISKSKNLILMSLLGLQLQKSIEDQANSATLLINEKPQ